MTRYARNSDPDTSHQAARKLDTATLENLVTETLLARGPMTTIEISEHVGVPRDSISPRMPALVKRNEVEDTGLRRAINGNRKCIIWKAVK